MTTWTTIETHSGYTASVAIDAGRPRVSTVYGDGEIPRHTVSIHQHECVEAIERTCGVWCNTSGSVADSEDGSEIWYPRTMDVQPTHWLTVDGSRVPVLPITDGCEPCDLSDDCGLTTRDEWLSGTGADYSLVDGVLCCNGSPVVGEWSLNPIAH